MPQTITPSHEDKSELAGRIYQSVDFIRAIEEKKVTTIDEVMALAKQMAEMYSLVLGAEVWIIDDYACLDCNATLDLLEKNPAT